MISSPAVDDTTAPQKSLTQSVTMPGVGSAHVLVLIWSRDEPLRAGEALSIPAGEPGASWTFGRDEANPRARAIGLVRQRPGGEEPTGALACPRISRAQLRLSLNEPHTLAVDNVGRCPMLHNGAESKRAVLAPGDVVELRHELVFLCAARPHVLPALPPGYPAPIQAFGEPDALGLVGEGPAMWELRYAIAALAPRPIHLLVRGPSGSGKELVARGIHAWSERRQGPLVARNAATLPEGLIDAELFGHARSFPNPGMPERPGLVGEASGGTLFLDEFAELPSSLQAHLLRVLDEGEYHRLGEARARRADLRLVAATNRPEAALKHDVLARLQGRIELPGLDAQREDIPLLIAHLVRRQAARAPGQLERFFPGGDIHGAPRTTPDLMTALVRHRYRTHMRELDALLLQASVGSRGKYLELTGGVVRGLAAKAPAAPPSASGGSAAGFTPDEERRLALLRRHGFNAAACSRDPEYGASRQTADLHIRQIMGRALAIGAWDVGDAVAILAGEDEAQRTKLQSRIEAFLLNLRHRLDEDGGEALRRSLASEWRAAAPVASKLLDAIEAGKIRGRG